MRFIPPFVWRSQPEFKMSLLPGATGEEEAVEAQSLSRSLSLKLRTKLSIGVPHGFCLFRPLDRRFAIADFSAGRRDSVQALHHIVHNLRYSQYLDLPLLAALNAAPFWVGGAVAAAALGGHSAAAYSTFGAFSLTGLLVGLGAIRHTYRGGFDWARLRELEDALRQQAAHLDDPHKASVPSAAAAIDAHFFYLQGHYVG